jgi:hypothetical protein
LTLGPAIYDRDVFALDIAGVLQATVKSAQTVREQFRRYDIEKPNHRHSRLLRARRQRPSGRRAAEKRDELAPPHVPPSVRGLHPTTRLLKMPRCA